MHTDLSQLLSSLRLKTTDFFPIYSSFQLPGLTLFRSNQETFFLDVFLLTVKLPASKPTVGSTSLHQVN